ncbi:MAG: hypothetical protein V3U49_00410 [Nitrososphaerales archaeon]
MSLLEEILEDLSKTVKYDGLTKEMILLTGISAFSSNPSNLYIKGPSSTGKSYNVIQCMKYFPENCVTSFGSLSPTAMIHDRGGRLESSDNRQIGIREEASGKASYFYEDCPGEIIPKDMIAQIIASSHYRVDLRNRIMVFLESPALQTLEMLRPILSHDKEEITYKITEKTKSGRLKALTTKITGWPAVIFCSASPRYMHEIITRTPTISAQEFPEKFLAANHMAGLAASHPKRENEAASALSLRLSNLISEMKYFDVIIPYGEQLADVLPSSQASDMRHFNHYQNMIKNYTVFSMNNRPFIRYHKKYLKGLGPDETYCISTLEDLSSFSRIYEEYSESIDSGLPSKALEIARCLRDLGPSSSEDISKATRSRPNTMFRSAKRLVSYELKLLKSANIVSSAADADDKRRQIYAIINPDEFSDGENPRLSPSPVLSISFGQKECFSWLDGICNEIGISNIEEAIANDKLVLGLGNRAVSKDGFISHILSKPIPTPLLVDYPKNMGVSKKPISS